MAPVPRDAAGNFLPPQYRLDSVPADEIRAGDLVSWNWGGSAQPSVVVHATRTLPPCLGRVVLLIERPTTGRADTVVLDPRTTVNRIEVLR